MSSVLHRITMQYIESVNTPDYPREQWVINPDLSLVAGVEREYWVLETTPEIPYQPAIPEVPYQPETTEINEEGETIVIPEVPYQPAIPEVLYQPEVNTVRAMTTEERDAWNALHLVADYRYVDTNLPAFYDPLLQLKRAVNETILTFLTKTTGGKNFYLDWNGSASNLKGCIVYKKSVLVAVEVSVQHPVNADVTVYLFNKGSSTPVCEVTLLANEVSMSQKFITAIQCDANSELSCFLASTANITTPSVRYSIAIID